MLGKLLFVSIALSTVASSASATELGSCGYRLGWSRSGSPDGAFGNAYSVAVDGTGDVFVLDASRSRVDVFDQDGNFLRSWGGPGSGDGEFSAPVSIAIDPSGNVFVSDVLDKRIEKFDDAGNFLTGWGSPGTGNGEFDAPLQLAVDPAGSVFVTDYHRVQKFDNAGNFVAAFGSEGTGAGQFSLAYHIAVDPSGNVFVTDHAFTPRIEKFDNDGNFVTAWNVGASTGDLGPIAVDADGNVFALDQGTSTINEYDNDGTLLLRLGGHSTIYGMAVDAAGNLFLARADHIEKVSCDANTYWLIGDDGGVGVVQNDTVIGRVTDQHGYFGSPVRDIAIDEAKGFAYAFMDRRQSDGKTPAVRIDLATLTATSTVTDPNGLTALGASTYGGALSPDGSRAYFTDQIELAIVDTSSDQVIAVVPVAPSDYAQGVRISPDGKTAYVRGFAITGGGQRIYVIDLVTNAVVTTVSLPNNSMPRDVKGALSASGFILSSDATTLYAVDGDARFAPITESSVYAIDTTTFAVTPVTSAGDSQPVPTGLLLLGRHLYVVSQSYTCCSGGVAVVDVDSHDVVAGIGLADNTGAIGVSLDESEIYVGATSGDFLFIINPATNALTGDVADPGNLMGSAQTAVDPFLPPIPPPSICESIPAQGCQPAFAEKSALKLVKGATAARNKLTWKWASSATVTPADLGVPSATSNYEICMYDQTGLVLSARAPAAGSCAGRACWQLSSSGAKYIDKSLTPDGVAKLTLKPGEVSHAKMTAKGKGANVSMPTLPLAPQVTLQLRRDDAPTCWEATYATASVNSTTTFKAKSVP